MGKTDRDILGEATGIDGQLRRRNVNSQNDGRGILLIQNPADQTLVRADLCRQMPGVGFVLRTGLTRVIFPHRVGMMIVPEGKPGTRGRLTFKAVQKDGTVLSDVEPRILNGEV